MDSDARRAMWNRCLDEVRTCSRCALASTRTNAVFGEGDCCSQLMFIGEAPGADEDEQGRPFVGAAGKLLTQILKAAGIEREDVYIANILKCRPPKNRDPRPEESTACDRFLQTQIMLVDPSIIVLLGKVALSWLMKTAEGITKLRGKWLDWHGISVMPMFHPSYLLRFSDDKRPGSPKHLTWLDIQEVKRRWDEVRSS